MECIICTCQLNCVDFFSFNSSWIVVKFVEIQNRLYKQLWRILSEKEISNFAIVYGKLAFAIVWQILLRLSMLQKRSQRLQWQPKCAYVRVLFFAQRDC